MMYNQNPWQAHTLQWGQEIDLALHHLFSSYRTTDLMAGEGILFSAMTYSVFAGGKRFRPLLCLAAAAAAGSPEGIAKALPAACALELIHTYSLIHDDLPCMDNDDFRRGRLTNHKVYGEGMAVLAGDGLLTLAFTAIADSPLQEEPALALEVIRELAHAAGIGGMVGGQAIDLTGIKVAVPPPGLAEEEIGSHSSPATGLERMHTLKTGALIRCACRIGGRIGGAGPVEQKALATYGDALGLAFQITDDLLDAEGDPVVTGKAARRDVAMQKVTYVTHFGIEEARHLAQAALARARQALQDISGGTQVLAAAIDQLWQREA